VTTGVGAEGLDVTDGESMLIADDPSEIADRVVRCYRDEELWQRISAAGQSVIATACSPKAVEAQMRLLLGEVAAVDETLASQANLSLR